MIGDAQCQFFVRILGEQIYILPYYSLKKEKYPAPTSEEQNTF